MRPVDAARLFVLAAIWGASFMFLRVVAPALGPVATADLRVGIAGLALIAWLAIRGVALDWRHHWKSYALVGAINSALPFLLYAFAALQLPASLLAILNASAPLFGVVLGALVLGEKFTAAKAAGLALGLAGVAQVSGGEAAAGSPATTWAILASLAAALCYAISGVYVKRVAARVASPALAGGSQVAAGLLLLPLILGHLPAAAPSGVVLANLLALALVCSALAYLLYYRLVADVGPATALTVTFLIPAFGMLWGALFLGERITWAMLGGCALIFAGVFLVSGTGARHAAPQPGRSV